MTESELIAEIRAMTGVSATALSDADLGTIIGVALDEYATYNPQVNFTATSGFITTVANQPDYDFPTGALWIIEVFWQPESSAMDDLTLQTYESFISDFSIAHPADLTIHYHQLASIRRYFAGSWKVLNGRIWLIPTPASSGENVALLYATARTLADLGDETDFLFKRLVAAYVYERRASELMQSSGWRAGAYQVSQSIGQSMADKAQREFQEVRARLAQAYGAATDYTITRPFGVS